jgi:hypothetical protein
MLPNKCINKADLSGPLFLCSMTKQCRGTLCKQRLRDFVAQLFRVAAFA